MSLWTMFKLCKYFSALARLYTMILASLSVYLAEEVMASNKSPPCENMTTVFYTAKREMTPLNPEPPTPPSASTAPSPAP